MNEEKLKSHIVYNMSIFKHEYCPHGGIRLYWEGDCGFGTYDLILDDEPERDEFGCPICNDDYKLDIKGYSECMDSNDDKKFLKQLLMSLADSIDIKE